MNEKNFKKQSKTDWARLEAMSDEEIDTSETRQLGVQFFANAKFKLPMNSVVISIDKDVNEWYQAQGANSKNLMAIALRIYADAHKMVKS